MSETVLKAAMISKKYKRLIPYALDWKMVYALDEVKYRDPSGGYLWICWCQWFGKNNIYPHFGRACAADIRRDRIIR